MQISHALLHRQLLALYGEEASWPPEIASLVAKVEETYREFEADYALLERSLELSSQELVQANTEMRVIVQAFPDRFLRLAADGTITSCRARHGDEQFDAHEWRIGRRIQELPFTQPAGTFANALERIAGGSPVESVEYRYVAGEERRTYEARLLPLRGQEVLAVVRNITERKQAEAEMVRAREAALEVAKLKAEFLANMSHEIRTPMTCIIGVTELLLETELSPEQREFLFSVKVSADALLQLINDILDFSKIEARKLTLEFIPFSMRDCVGGALKLIAVRAHQKGLELVCHIPADVPDRLVGDPSRLRQVLINLVGNAIKFTERGEIELRVENGGEGDNRSVLQFSVRDTGIGIPAQRQQHIFGAFTQADGSTSRKYGGTGLGLAISAQLVEMMGGSIGVESREHAGSTFSFMAAFGIEPPVEAPPGVTSLGAARGMRILVVDDNATNRSILTSLLKRWQARVVAVGDGPAAIDALRGGSESAEPFDLVLLDVQMPGMDGFSVAEVIQRDLGLSVPIIVLTSSGVGGDASRFRAMGLAGYLTKPVMSTELLEAIQAVSGGTKADRSKMFVTRHSLRERRAQLRILLAEDNPVNRSVIRRLLEKRGHFVRLVENGRQAVDAVEAEQFDLVLMDVQMPELDGLEATAAIRETERGTDRHLPILALTAHAMKGDLERCIAAGMDAHASKPIQTEELFATMEALVTRRPADLPVERPESPPVEVFDLAEALRRMEGDRTLLAEAVRLQLEEASRAIATLRDALERGDSAAIRTTAHRMKSGLWSLAANSAADAAHRLEVIAAGGDQPALTPAVKAFEAALEQLGVALEPLSRAA